MNMIDKMNCKKISSSELKEIVETSYFFWGFMWIQDIFLQDRCRCIGPKLPTCRIFRRRPSTSMKITSDHSSNIFNDNLKNMGTK